jgi:hypothetical protein
MSTAIVKVAVMEATFSEVQKLIACWMEEIRLLALYDERVKNSTFSRLMKIGAANPSLIFRELQTHRSPCVVLLLTNIFRGRGPITTHCRVTKHTNEQVDRWLQFGMDCRHLPRES